MPYTNLEAARLLRSRVKPYNYAKPQMSQPLFSANLTKLENDLLKPKTAKNFLEKFGFKGVYNMWELDIKNWHIEAKPGVNIETE